MLELKVLMPAEYDLLSQAPDGLAPDRSCKIMVFALEVGRLVARGFLQIRPSLTPWHCMNQSKLTRRERC